MLLVNKEINETTYKRLVIHNTVAPKLYGLSKLHEPLLIKFRHICSCFNSPSNNIDKNSFAFVTEIRNVIVPANHKLISMVVIPLFTNISNDMVKGTITDNWSNISMYTNIPLINFTKLIELCFDSSFFSFEEIFL